MHAVAPHLQNLEQQNADLRQRLAVEARHSFDQRVERAVPNYREIDRNPRWHRWLLSLDPLSGCARQQPLNQAIVGSDANRVISFFRGFLQVDQATGQASLPASGRARSPNKPVYARAQIAHRRGAYAGREAEWARQEADFYTAQREGACSAGSM